MFIVSGENIIVSVGQDDVCMVDGQFASLTKKSRRQFQKLLTSL
ncbi:MAG TPA: hypothetical protein VJ697_03275 [Nitrososphaeraceae archaeon]|nr:hypothetical protein [Nitrososphaeraceae archaeon]